MSTSTTRDWRVETTDGDVSAIYDPPSAGAETAVFVCAHGAGGNIADRGLVASTSALRANGLGVVRFNFRYKELRTGRPDPMPVLMATIVSVVAHVRKALAPTRLIIGGRSMGGRAASMLAAEHLTADGLLLLAYPLHSAGHPEKLRDAHLPKIAMPVLCFNGTRDALCTKALMEHALESVTAPWDMHWLKSADHSFHVLKSSGRTDADVLAEIGSASGAWAARLPA